MIVIHTGAGLCPDCEDQKQYRYQLVDMTNASRARSDRLWLCPLRHSERDVDDRRRRTPLAADEFSAPPQSAWG